MRFTCRLLTLVLGAGCSGTTAIATSSGSGSTTGGATSSTTTTTTSGSTSEATSATATASSSTSGTSAATTGTATTGSGTTGAGTTGAAGSTSGTTGTLPGNTWYIRQGSGTRYDANVTTGQCDGLADVDYSGSGVNQHCAFNDVRYLWLDGTYGVSQWVISGGDTVVIRGCSAAPDQQNPDPPHCRIGWDTSTGPGSLGWCAGDNSCSMPPPPAGTAAQHTRILGECVLTNTCNTGNTTNKANLTQLFGGFEVGQVIDLSGAQYVDLEGLEITSHNGKCTRVGATSFPGCATFPPAADDYANWGIITTDTTSNITLQDVYIHGLTTTGLSGPIGGPFTLTRVAINFNAFAGWNFDDGAMPQSTPDAPGSSITQSYVSMEGNGCLEEYPLVDAFPALACWDTNSGGFGDSWSGQATELDSFTCDHCTIMYNAKDAALGPHTLLNNLRLTNSIFLGNMGQQAKWGMNPGSTAVVENNLYEGNCNRMSEQLPGAVQNFAQSTGLQGSYLSAFCRAAGDFFAFFAGPDAGVLIAGNTLVGYNPTFFDLSCSPANSCASTPYIFTDNVYLGYTTTTSYYPNSGEAPGLYYLSDTSVPVVSSYNVEYGVRNGDCQGAVDSGVGNVCADPLFVGELAQGAWPPESALDNFDFTPTSGSPVIGAGIPIPGLTTDFYGNPRPSPPSAGAVEP